MDIKKCSEPYQLERYSFLWSQARLIIAAVALFIGGIPPVLAFNPIPAFYGVLRALLVVAWIISGTASGYMLYRWNSLYGWNSGQRTLFGGKAPLDTAAFFVSVVSGLNLGIAGLLGTNIGMSISSNRFIFAITALLYLASAVYLFRRWNAAGQKVF